LSDSAFNEFRLQVARRGIHFGYSDLPAAADIGVNMSRLRPTSARTYSTVDRIERRFEFTDNATLTRGPPYFKFGATQHHSIALEKAADFPVGFWRWTSPSAPSRCRFLGFPDCVNQSTGATHTGTMCAGRTWPSILPQSHRLQPTAGYSTHYIQGIHFQRALYNLPLVLAQDTWRSPESHAELRARYDFEITRCLPCHRRECGRGKISRRRRRHPARL